jgi:hypothetical protein
MPDSTITLPGGLHVKKKVAITVALGSVAIGGYFYYRQRQASQAAAATTATDSSAQIDPQTGFAYGTPEDQAALAGLSGATLGQSNTGASFVGGQVIGYDQFGNPIYGQGQPGSGMPGSFTSNAQWTQSAEALMGSDGADAIAAALGKYLLGQPLSPDQVTIVQQAIAAEGFPPNAGFNGNPPGYLTAPPVGGTGGGGTGGGTGAGPGAKNPVTGIHAVPRTTQVDVHWNALPNAKSYLVKAWIGSKVVSQTTASGTSATLHNLKGNTSYKISVWGQPGSGSTGSTTTRTK